MFKKIFIFVSGLFFLLLNVSYLHASAVDLAWAPPVDGGEVEGYVIYGCTTGGDYSDPIVWQIVGETYATISGLDKNNTYYFIVKAYNSAGFSPASNEVVVEANSDSYYDDGTDDGSDGSTSDVVSSSSNSSGGSEGGGCFISTAVD